MKPSPIALGMVRLSTQLLPSGDVRQRYRWELVADLYHIDRSHQLSYATGVVSTTWQLRRELTQEVDPMKDTTATPSIPLLCRLNLRHQWHTERTEDGGRYRCCARCGKEDPRLGNSGMPFG